MYVQKTQNFVTVTTKTQLACHKYPLVIRVTYVLCDENSSDYDCFFIFIFLSWNKLRGITISVTKIKSRSTGLFSSRESLCWWYVETPKKSYWLFKVYSKPVSPWLWTQAGMLSNSTWDVISSLTHWRRDKMTDISQTAFSNEFFEWKCVD